MILSDLIAQARDGKYKLVLYKQDGMCWVRRGECAVPARGDFDAGWSAAIEKAQQVIERVDIVTFRFGGQEYDDANKTLGAAARALEALKVKT